MLNKRQIEFLDELKKNLGIVETSLKNADVSREEFNEWKTKDFVFQEALDEINSIALDYVENKLLQEIRDGNVQAISFYLKTKGKGRGYV